MAHLYRLEDLFMTRTQKNLSHEEACVIIDDVVSLALEANNEELRKEFQRSTRATQAGYDITLYLMQKGLIRFGDNYSQQKMEV